MKTNYTWKSLGIPFMWPMLCIKNMSIFSELSLNSLRTQRKQLEEIFKLLETDKDKFGVSSMDDLQAQMKLYTR